MRRTGSIVTIDNVNNQIIISDRVGNDILYKDGMSDMTAGTSDSEDSNLMFTIEEINMSTVIGMKMPAGVVA